MEEKNEMTGKEEILKLTNEFTYRKYLMNKEQIKDFFKKITVPEYIALHHVASGSEMSDIYSVRTYLKELSEKMQLTIHQTSKMIGILRDKGLLVWSHDGNGSEGTYVTITDNGRKLLQEQEDALKQYYEKVISRFGKENLIQLLQLMKQLETIMSSEIEEWGDTDEIHGSDE